MDVRAMKPAIGVGSSILASGSEASSKKAVGRTIKQSRKYNLIAVFFGRLLKASLLIGTAYFFWHIYHHALISEKFNLSEIQFYGTRYIDTRRLGGLVRGEFPKNLLQMDLKKLQDRLEMEPWILRAEVRRVLPDILCISLIERAPKAVALIQGVSHIIDDEGVILGKYEPRFGRFDLPIMKGLLTPDQDNFLEENRKRSRLFFKVVEELDENGARHSKDISEIDVSNPDNAVLLPMNDTALIYIGDTNFLKRYQTFLSNVSEYQRLKETRGDIKAIDLRFENQIVIVPKMY